MSEATIIGIDLAKRVFQPHGAREGRSIVFRPKLRAQFGAFVAQASSKVRHRHGGACATTHGWGLEFEQLGHEVRLILPIYVKPFVKRQKSDAANAEAIVEAAFRSTMRIVLMKSEAQQARAMLFRARQMFVGQRTPLINALRRHLAEHGKVAARGPAHLKRLEVAINDDDTALLQDVREAGPMYLGQIESLNAPIVDLERKMKCTAREDDVARRAQTMLGVRPITALAIETFAPELTTFRRGRDIAAWPALYQRNV